MRGQSRGTDQGVRHAGLVQHGGHPVQQAQSVSCMTFDGVRPV